MPSQTTYYNLWMFDPSTDTGSTFLTFRTDIAGTGAGTNMIILDAALHTHDTQITALQSVRGVIYVPLTFQSANYFTAPTVTGISSYADGLVIDASLNQDCTGTVTININSLGIKSLLKYNSTGSSTINLAAGDMKANKEYIFRYSVVAGAFIWIDATAGDQINVGGTSGNFVSLTSTGVLQDSGVGDTSLVHITGTETITGAKTFNLPPNFASQSISGAATLASASAPIVLVDTTSAAYTLNLPSSPVTGEWFIIIDNTGQYSTHNLTLSPNGKNIDGSSSNLILATNYSSIRVHYNGTTWNSVSITGLSNTTHRGLVPVSPNDATQFLNGASPTAYANVKDSDLSTSAITTNDATTVKHGFLPQLSGNATDALKGDGTWGSAGSSFWTLAPTPTRTGNTTFTMATDQTTIFKKGLLIRWKESAVSKFGMVSIPSTFSSTTTVTIIGDTMASIDAASLMYCSLGAEPFKQKFGVAGTLGATGTDIANAWNVEEPYIVLGADISVGTAGTTNSTTVDIMKGSSSMFTVKPTLASTIASSPTPFTADTATTLALGDRVRIDLTAIQTTAAIDLYVFLYVFPARLEFMT